MIKLLIVTALSVSIFVDVILCILSSNEDAAQKFIRNIISRLPTDMQKLIYEEILEDSMDAVSNLEKHYAELSIRFLTKIMFLHCVMRTL